MAFKGNENEPEREPREQIPWHEFAGGATLVRFRQFEPTRLVVQSHQISNRRIVGRTGGVRRFPRQGVTIR